MLREARSTVQSLSGETTNRNITATPPNISLASRRKPDTACIKLSPPPPLSIPQILFGVRTPEQVVRQHRRDLVDHALGLMEALPPTTPGSPSETLRPSPLVSVDAFRAGVAQFEELSRSTPPRQVSELIYSDAYMMALGSTRQRGVRIWFAIADARPCITPVNREGNIFGSLLWSSSGNCFFCNSLRCECECRHW